MSELDKLYKARLGVAANAIGYAMFAEEGSDEVEVTDEQLKRIWKAAERVLEQLGEFDDGMFELWLDGGYAALRPETLKGELYD